MNSFVAFALKPLTLLIVSTLALFIGPFVHHVIKNKRSFLRFIDGFCVIVITGLVLLHILPHTVADSGPIAFLAAFVGVLMPTFLENKLHGTLARKTHAATLLLALIGVSLHEFADGLALANSALIENQLPVAIILHRLPIGLVIWWLMRPAYGTRKALLTIVAMAIATLLGFGIGSLNTLFVTHAEFGIFEALVAGSLLHVILHRHDAFIVPVPTNQSQPSSGLGAILGIGALYFMSHSQDASEHASNFSQRLAIFLTLAADASLSLLFAYLISGILQVFFSPAAVKWLRAGSHFSQALKGMVFGLPLPICACGVIPEYRALIKHGTPLAAAIAFFVAMPELGVDAFLISIPLLGAHFALIRLICAALAALLTGWIIGSFFKNKKASTSGETIPSLPTSSLIQKIKQSLSIGFGDAVDHTGPWILLGLFIATLVQTAFLAQGSIFESMPDILLVPLFALLGMPLYICSSGATPVIAVLIHYGVSPGAALAFLLVGPATNFSTLSVLKELHGKKLSLVFAIVIVAISVALGYGVDFLLAEKIRTPSLFSQKVIPSWYQILSLAFLALLYLVSILRRGPRFWINQIIAFESSHKHHSHAHTHPDHHHDHDHHDHAS